MTPLAILSVCLNSSHEDCDRRIVEIPVDSNCSYDLALAPTGELVLIRLVGSKSKRSQRHRNLNRLATIFPADSRGQREWLFAAKRPDVTLDGLTPPLLVTLLKPGTLIAFEQRFWMITCRWQPRPVSAPAELSDKPCPVCGSPLHLATVIECPCGRWMHLEDPETPDNDNALNCYVHANECGGCGRPTTLEPYFSPEVPERLLTPAHADAWD